MTSTSLSHAIDAVLNDRSRGVDEVLTEYFADDYRQRTGGVWAGRAEFLAMMEQVRQLTNAPVAITVLNELDGADGSVFAERHVLRFLLDGTEQYRESYVFGRRVADGRFAEVEELTLAQLHKPPFDPFVRPSQEAAPG